MTDGEISSAGGIAFDPISGVRVARAGSFEPVRAGSLGHPHAQAWPGCEGRGDGGAVFAINQIVDEDLFPLVRQAEVVGFGAGQPPGKPEYPSQERKDPRPIKAHVNYHSS